MFELEPTNQNAIQQQQEEPDFLGEFLDSIAVSVDTKYFSVGKNEDGISFNLSKKQIGNIKTDANRSINKYRGGNN